ncbi:hypothetical protein [Helicobacter bizzozeronii]|uniref:hypothetical protein n=1 Tax=Helicobacter bizzozeronii TaxID=56877 RepID=UPI000CF15A87|nr:hypothetical protein [Helicobacter bizzozeronii]
MKKTTLFCLELVLMPFVTFASCIFFYALVFCIALDLNLALIASLILGGLSFYPIFKIYKRNAPSEVWAWRCVISGVFNALAVVLWYALFI